MFKSTKNEMFRSYEAKLRPPEAAVETNINRVLNLCRILYNAALEERQSSYRKLGRSPTYNEQCISLTEIRHQNSEYADLDATMTRLTANRKIDLAFKSFFRRVRLGEVPGYPRFKSRDRFKTLVFGKSGWKLKGLSLWIRGIGDLDLISVPKIEGKLIGLKLIRRSYGYVVQFLSNLGTVPAKKPAKVMVGIDVGLKTFATLSDGSVIENPRFLKKSQERLKDLQRSLASKQKGSNNRAKAKKLISRQHEKISNRRKDFLHKITKDLVKRYDGFVVEDLNIEGMLSKERKVANMSEKGMRGIRRGILDVAWGMFSFYLGYKAEEAGKPKLNVPAKNTSQRCSGCHEIVRKTLHDRTHVCPYCGLEIDRDLNAALNILDLGLKVSGSVATENHDEH